MSRDGETWEQAHRTRSGAAKARQRRRRVDPDENRQAGFRGDDVPTLAEVERRIMHCDDELASLVEDHFAAGEEAAEAEARWKAHRDRVLVMIANDPDISDGASDTREARAKMTREDDDPESPLGRDLYHTYKIMEAREKSVDRAIRALQTRMTGLMSIAKGIRQVTDTGEGY